MARLKRDAVALHLIANTGCRRYYQTTGLTFFMQRRGSFRLFRRHPPMTAIGREADHHSIVLSSDERQPVKCRSTSSPSRGLCDARITERRALPALRVMDRPWSVRTAWCRRANQGQFNNNHYQSQTYSNQSRQIADASSNRNRCQPRRNG